MSPREYLPFFTVRQRRRPLPSVALNSGGDHDNFSRETLRHDKAQRGIHWPTMHWSSWCLSVALTIWLLVQFRKKNYIFGYRDTSLAGDLQSLYASRRMRPSKNFWRSDTVIDNHNNNDDHHDNFVHQTRHKKKDVEAIPDGCRLPYQWQRTSFPDCNRVHEIDLKQHLNLHRRPLESDSSTTTTTTDKEYYIRSGLWRDVFAMRPDGTTSVVIKLMKVEHDVDQRNLDRHRRDALTMERLTAAPNVVDIYGFCGNTVLTEQAMMGLDQRVKQGPLSIDQTLQWALGAARGIAALHSLDIIHADVQTQQFLINSQGIIKINDFNRCRFVPRNNTSLAICPIGIPSAPGLWRSPEEYSGQRLVPAMDVYSLGNVLHELLVGHRPFHGLGATQLKRNVQNGVRPEIVTHNDLSQKLADLIYQCLAHDVDQRIQADKLVRELEALVNTTFKSEHSKEQ